MRAIFIMIKADAGHVRDVAERLAELENFSEGYSISGAYDLLVKLYVEDFDGLGNLVTDQIQRIPHIRETFTILTFRAFT
ncbi:MAG TPA: Lrp/AsnC ligand binding domain-containing protein [Solirubrobacteraceae bacterium]|nr:Lrp/AsnC ligand binding domain-containing protein [Solirubrobacteraceae bacterium]